MSKLPPPSEARWPEGAVFTVGHSTLPIDTFIALLETYGIERLVDIRTVPRSRHNPQFNSDALDGSLRAETIEYVLLQKLGGLRHARKDSPNAGWRNKSFRGYADYMQTEPFRAAFETLMTESRNTPTAIMCAEAVPWRCHRSLIADALAVRGWAVRHIMTRTKADRHRLTPFAVLEHDWLTYPPPHPLAAQNS